jgi:precorrin-8X/cobalt-precorrin-8 methylmutase
MSVFDFYVMVDWSGANRRIANRANCIWLAHGSLHDRHPTTESPSSRSEAIDRVVELAANHLGASSRSRVLACFDFGLAYPRGFASHLPADNDACQPWERVWRYLKENVQDDIATAIGKRPSNISNRFDIANELNRLVAGTAQGPFWCVEPNWRANRVASGQRVDIPQQMPRGFVSARGTQIPSSRFADDEVESDYPFRLYGNGSVGSQMITGIPMLQRLRESPKLQSFGGGSVWPFQTGWARDDDQSWPGETVRMVIAEIYPSVRTPMEDAILDRGQVRAVWQWARDLDKQDRLRTRFQRPQRLTADQEAIARCEEGWILH